MESYNELQCALTELVACFNINKEVYVNAELVLNNLMKSSIPIPKLLCHGDKSIVFDWNGLSITVASIGISVLVGDYKENYFMREVNSRMLSAIYRKHKPLIKAKFKSEVTEYCEIDK